MRYQSILSYLGLPRQLIRWIADDTLHDQIARAYQSFDEWNARMDAFEALNPERSALLPWAEARAAWKTAGCPRPEWYEVLMLQEGLMPLYGREIDNDLLNTAPKRRQKVRRAERRAARATSNGTPTP